RQDDADDLHRAAPQGVAEQPQLQSEKVCSHSMPSALLRPPASSTKRSSSDLVPRTCLIVPESSTLPSTMIATESQILWMRSMLWLDSTTVPPASVYLCRISITFAAETGSTDSNGSSSTSSRGEWIIAAAMAIFLVMPAE